MSSRAATPDPVTALSFRAPLFVIPASEPESRNVKNAKRKSFGFTILDSGSRPGMTNGGRKIFPTPC